MFQRGNEMQKNQYETDSIKPIFSGHETFPLRYGWLKKVYDVVVDAELNHLNAKDIFNNPESISSFGVGKNMVASMRHWAIHTGILESNKITPQAHNVLSDSGLDPWMENPTTLWMLHWQLARQPNLVTYHWFFNYYNGGVFDRKFINDEINELCIAKDWRVPSATTLKRDIECFVRMYAGKDLSTRNYGDESIESPLSELSLIKPMNKQGFFMPNRGPKASLSTAMFMLALADFWKEHSPSASSLSLEALLYDPTSPGRIFLLDETGLFEKIYSLHSDFSGKIDWSETAGMRQFTISPNTTLCEIRSIALNLIETEYNQ